MPRPVDYGYDSLNRLSSVTDNLTSGGTTLYHYDDTGRLSSYDYPNGLSHAFGYDTFSRTQSVKVGSAIGTPQESLVASYGYTFYATGNRHTVSELTGRVVTWGYDNLWRLQNETIAGSATAGSIGYTYDAVGNRLSRTSTVPGIASQTEGYNTDDENNSATFDSDGNMKAVGSNQYAYDAENRLTSLNTGQAVYAYDGDGQLVSRTIGGVTTTYLIDSDNPTGYTQIAEERVGGAVVKSYVYGSQRISMRASGGTRFYGYDAHSGVRTLMDSTGSVTDTYEYDAFGSVIGKTGTSDNAFTYRGEQVDSALGLQYLRARWRNPGLGSFTTRDTWEGLPAYTFAGQRPTVLFDPTGHLEIPDVSIGAVEVPLSRGGGTSSPVSSASCGLSRSVVNQNGSGLSASIDLCVSIGKMRFLSFAGSGAFLAASEQQEYATHMIGVLRTLRGRSHLSIPGTTYTEDAVRRMLTEAPTDSDIYQGLFSAVFVDADQDPAGEKVIQDSHPGATGIKYGRIAFVSSGGDIWPFSIMTRADNVMHEAAHTVEFYQRFSGSLDTDREGRSVEQFNRLVGAFTRAQYYTENTYEAFAFAVEHM